jgi:RarD protein
MKRSLGYKIMFMSAMAVFGTIGLFVKSVNVSSGELALYRALMATVLIGGFMLCTRQRIVFREIRRQLPLLLLSGAAMGFNWILLFEAYKYTAVSVATLSYYFAPIIVTVVSPLIFKEKMGARQWVCFGMSTLGIVLITGIGDLSAGSNHLLGIGFALGAAVLYACVMLLNKGTKGVEGIQRTFLQFIAAIAVLIPYVALTGGVSLSGLNGVGWACLLVVGIVHTGVTYCLYFTSMKELPGQEVALLSYIDPLMAVLCSVLILRETLTLPQAIGGAMILGFTLYNELAPTIKQKKK